MNLLKHSSVPKETAVARYAFTAQKEKDLTFNVGDMITIEKKRQNGWWIGTLSNGKRGYFPNNYVEVMPNNNNSSEQVIRMGDTYNEDKQQLRKVSGFKEEEGGLIFNSSFNDHL